MCFKFISKKSSPAARSSCQSDAGSPLQFDFPHAVSKTESLESIKSSNSTFRDAVSALCQSSFASRCPCSEYTHFAAAGRSVQAETEGTVIAVSGRCREIILVLSKAVSFTLEGESSSVKISLRRGDFCQLPALMPGNDGTPIENVVSASKATCLCVTSPSVLEKFLGQSESNAQAEFVLQAPEAKRCPKCGTFAVDSDLFCGKCGAQLEGIRSSQQAISVDDNEHVALLQQMSRDELGEIGLIGCGGFGYVSLAEHRVTHQTVAMKTLSKGWMKKTGSERNVFYEKYALLIGKSPMITELYATMQTEQTLIFVLEACLGGELYATYRRYSFHGKEQHAQYYVASTALGLAHLHSLHIIYRGANPENIVLDAEGRAKLSDLGLASFTLGKSYTMCGVPDYFPPEVVASTGHHSGYDWWTLGVLLFELMAGNPPFDSATPMQTYQKIVQGIDKVSFPTACQGSVAKLIKAILQKDANARLPLRKGGLENVKKHEWFKDFYWPALIDGSMTPPYVPNVNGPKDRSNFTAVKEDMPRSLQYKDDGSNFYACF